jgi:spore germination protein GerM
MRYLIPILSIIATGLLILVVLKSQGSFELPALPTIANIGSTTETGTREIALFFANDTLDPAISCTKVFPVVRHVPNTPSIARATLEALLAGPTGSEEKAGYSSLINASSKIHSITIQGGMASVDFDVAFGQGIAGSCHLQTIRAEVAETLKQFPSVQNVMISVDGRSEDALQP